MVLLLATLSLVFAEGLSPDRALHDLGLACEAGSATACGNLGLMYEEGQHVDRDLAAAVVFYAHACEAGDPGSCSQAALHLVGGGPDITADPARALGYAGAACDGGEITGCWLLGVQHLDGLGTPVDYDRAAEAFARACAADHPRACRLVQRVRDHSEEGT